MTRFITLKCNIGASTLQGATGLPDRQADLAFLRPLVTSVKKLQDGDATAVVAQFGSRATNSSIFVCPQPGIVLSFTQRLRR